MRTKPFLLATVLLAVMAAACNGADMGPSASDASGRAPDGGGADPGLFSASCPEGTATGASSRPLTTNNAAELSGAVLGRATLSSSDLRRPLATHLVPMFEPLVVGPASLIRSDNNTEAASAVITVTTTGRDVLCLVSADVRWMNAAGVQVADDSQVFLTGSVGEIGSNYTDTCIGPGDTAYLISLSPLAPVAVGLFSTVTSVEIAATVGGQGKVAPGSLIPVAYRPCGRSPLFEVALESRGPQEVAFWIDLVGVFVLADDQGPLDWGFLEPRSGLGVQPVGGKMLVGAVTFLPGSATRLQAYLSFDDPSLYAFRASGGNRPSAFAAARAQRSRLWTRTQGTRSPMVEDPR